MTDRPYDNSTWKTGIHLLSGTPDTPDEVTYFYIDCPPSSSSTRGTILLIHGFPETSHQFRHIITPLSQQGYRIIAPDYRGAGYSSKPRGLDGYRKSVIAADLVMLLDKMKVEKVHLVGHDIGGMIAHSFASRYPERTISVMWGECPQPGTKAYDENCHNPGVWHFTFHWQADLPELLVQGKERIYLTHFYNRLAHRRNVWTPDVLDFYTDAFSQSGAMRAGMDLYRSFHADAEENKAHLKLHGRCKVPSAAFSGAKSFLASIAQKQTEELYENVEVVEVEESGHWAAEENPEDTVEKILAFVGKHSER